MLPFFTINSIFVLVLTDNPWISLLSDKARMGYWFIADLFILFAVFSLNNIIIKVFKIKNGGGKILLHLFIPALLYTIHGFHLLPPVADHTLILFRLPGDHLWYVLGFLLMQNRERINSYHHKFKESFVAVSFLFHFY